MTTSEFQRMSSESAWARRNLRPELSCAYERAIPVPPQVMMGYLSNPDMDFTDEDGNVTHVRGDPRDPRRGVLVFRNDAGIAWEWTSYPLIG